MPPHNVTADMSVTRGENMTDIHDFRRVQMHEIDRDGFNIDKRRRRRLAKGLILFAAVLFLVLGTGGAYADQICSDCHDTGQHGQCDGGNCAACHGNPPVDAGGLIHPYADQPAPVASGSYSAGAHSKHATPSGQNYGCSVCHYSGMSASSGQMIGGTNNGNGLLQMGFAIPMPGGTTADGGTYDGISGLAYPYEATNGTTVTTGGTQTCSSIYCHSDGTAVSTGAALTDASPAWDTPGPLDCATCHGYPPSYANGQPKANSHMAPGHNVQCNVCHSATTSDGTTIENPAKHANAVYNVLPADASVDFSYAYDAGGGTCSVVVCHGGLDLQWGAVITGLSCELCHTGRTTAHMATDGSGHPVPDTCTSCHTQYASTSHAGTPRNLSNSCGSCHATTGLSFSAHSTTPMTAVVGECTICHVGKMGTHATFTGGTAHVLTTEATCTTCHSETPRRRPTAATMGSCQTCHGVKWDNHEEFSGGPQGCLDCHVIGGTSDVNFIIDNGCTPCHGWVPSVEDALGMHSVSGGPPFAAFSASAGSGINAWTVTLDTSQSDGTISSVDWGDGIDTLTTHTYASAGVKSITLTILKSGQTASVAHSITLYNYPISGTVKMGGVGLGGVTITLTGPTSGTTVTDSGGAYSFIVMPGTYSVHAAKAGYTMSADVTSIVAEPGMTNADFTAQLGKAALTVSKANSTLGEVSSSPAGIDCDATCSGPSTAMFDVGSVVSLTASISGGNTVNSLTCIGGTVAICGSTSCYSDVTIAPGGNSCTAVFSDAPNVVRRVSGAAEYDYPNLAEGLTAAVNGDIFYLKGIIFNESVIFDKIGISVTLKGGYDDSSYTLRSGTTTLIGPMTIGPGSVSVNRLTLQPMQ